MRSVPLLARLLVACLAAAAAETNAEAEPSDPAASGEPTMSLPRPTQKGQKVRRASPAAGDKRASVQFVITNAMRAELARLGYSEAELDERRPTALTAERAKAIVDNGIRRPKGGELPSHWTRASQQRPGGFLGSKLLSPGTVLTAGALAWAACIVDPACVRGVERLSRNTLRTLSKVARQYGLG